MLASASWIIGYFMLAPVDGETSEASAGAAGLGLLFIVLPMLGWSALLLIPSSLALFNSELRRRSSFKGYFWFSLWRLNLLISAGYIAVVFYFAYLCVKVSFGF